MRVTIDISKEDIAALCNAATVFGREVHGATLGCQSWFRDELAKVYPDMDPFELDEKMVSQVYAVKRITNDIRDEVAEDEDLG